jgi:broad specificity phosphatase PhoE
MKSSRFGGRPLWATITGALLLIILGGPLATAQDAVLDDEALLTRLREGGLVIIFRHGQSDRTQTDQLDLANASDLSAGQRQAMYLDCSRQRNLSETGRKELKQVRTAIRTMELAISDVKASPMCRTRETAWLIFGRVTPNPALVSRQRQDDRRQLAGTIPPHGTNTVLVSHGQLVAGVVRSANNEPESAELALPEGSAVILEPLGDGQYNTLAKLLPTDWERLAKLVD